MSKQHKVSPGDCIASIAFANGFAPDTVWDHEANRALKEKRKDLHQLVAGDQVHVPDLRQRVLKLATDRIHTFRRRAVPETLKMRLLDENEPRKHLDYFIEIAGVRTAGRTDGDGWIEHRLSPGVKEVTLLIGEHEQLDLEVGALPPLDQESGIVARLRNLGYLDSEEVNPHQLRNAIADFQKDNKFDTTGLLDDQSREKLAAQHGS